MSEVEKVDTTECERLHAVSAQSQTCGAFLDWLRQEKGVTLAVRHEHDETCEGTDGFRVCGARQGEYFPAQLPSMERLLAEFFHIDLNKVEKERRALLDAIRKDQAHG